MNPLDDILPVLTAKYAEENRAKTAGWASNMLDNSSLLGRIGEGVSGALQKLPGGAQRHVNRIRSKYAPNGAEFAKEFPNTVAANSHKDDMLNGMPRAAYDSYDQVDKRRTGLRTLGGMAVGGAGLAGLGYGMGDADTTSNKIKNTANNTLGTNFSTQSRLGALING